MATQALCAIYDFELAPYALGDVLTWNVQSAVRCEELGRHQVDIFVCADERFPSSIFQRGLVTAENCALFFSDLFGAFGTHPRPGNLYRYRRREELVQRLRELASNDAANAHLLADYEHALANRHDDEVLIGYFARQVHSHERINDFAKRHGRIPLLRASAGCEPDVAGLVAKRFAGKRIVTIHVRLRSLDVGYGGEHTYGRDSDFLEWYEFLREAGTKYPDVQFIVLGRLQEKPLELLRLPNVLSLRPLGLGLGHELTLMLRSDLFMGTSSGFATMANFSEVPYFITKMTRESCKAYRIEYGAERLPFATNRQFLVYEPETRESLMRLLERGLEGVPPRGGAPSPVLDPTIDVRSWEWERSLWLHPGATTSRYFTNDAYREKETAFLLWPKLMEAQKEWRNGFEDRAWAILERIEANFSRVCEKFPELLRLRIKLAMARDDAQTLGHCKASLRRLAPMQQRRGIEVRSLTRFLARGYPAITQIKYYWKRKHRVPRKLAEFALRLAKGRNNQ
jgi:hypothetical protein